MLVEIHEQEAEEAQKKKQENEKESAELAPVSTRKLERNSRNIEKCKVKEIYSLLLTIYNINSAGSKLRKTDFVTHLQNEITRDPGRYDCYIATLNDASDTAQQYAKNEVQPANDTAVQLFDNEEQPAVEDEVM